MLRDTQIAVIRQKCLEANPGIMIRRPQQLLVDCGGSTRSNKVRPVRLADVLKLFCLGKFDAPGLETVRHAYHQICILWTLESDLLAHQSEECVDFIYWQLARHISQPW